MAYDAFISYSHSADGRVAPAVRDGLQKLAKPWNKRRALNVFLDQTSLEASSGLRTTLVEKLDDAEFLVVLATPESAGSPWVNEEIAHWLESRRGADRIRLVLTGGTLDWDEAAGDFARDETTAAAPALEGAFAEEPLWLDLHWARDDDDLDIRDNPRFKDSIATLAAPMHGMSKEELVGADLDQFRRSRRLRRAAVAGLAMLTVVAVIAGIVALVQRAEAIRQRDEAVAKSLAAEAQVAAVDRTDYGLLLALESIRTTPTREGMGAIISGLIQPVNLRPLVGHTDQVLAVAYSPDGGLLASAGHDGTIRFWEAAGGEPRLRPLTGHRGTVASLAFHPDGATLASAGWDGTIQLWDVGEGRRRRDPLTGHSGEVAAVAFHPDGTTLASGGWDGTVRLWDVAEGRQIGDPLSGHVGEVVSVAFHPDGTALASAGWDGTVHVWDVTRTGAPPVVLAGHQGRVDDVAWSPTGLLASAGEDGLVRFWDVGSGSSVGRPLDHAGAEVFGISFSADGSELTSVADDASLSIWDVADRRRLLPGLSQHTVTAFDVAYSPAGRAIASGGFDAVVRLWRPGGLGATLSGHTASATSVDFAPDGGRLVSAGADGTIRLWDATTREPIGGPLRGHVDSLVPDFGPGLTVPVLREVAFAPDGEVLVSAGGDGTVRRWDAVAGEQLGEELVGHDGPVRAVAVSPDGTLIASGGLDTTVRLWDLETGAAVGEPLRGFESSVSDVAFDADGSLVAAGDDVGVVLVWDPRTGERVGPAMTADPRTAVSALDFSPADGELAFAVVDPGGRKAIWRFDPVAGRQTADPLPSEAGVVLDLDYSADGALIVGSGFAGTVEWWRLDEGGESIAALAAASQSAVAIDADGTTVATAGVDGEVRLWPPPDSWRSLACQAAARNMSADEWEDLGNDPGSYVRHCADHPAGVGAPADAPAVD